MNIYIQRYRNALKKAAKINRLIKKGYIVMHERTPLHQGFVLRGKEIMLQASDNVFYRYYEHTPDYDHGYYTKIDEWNAKFNAAFEVYPPTARVQL
jgi:hypothetical protein